MDKNAIKKYAVWARNELIARVSQKALQYGITKENIDAAVADSINGKLLTDTEKKQRQALIARIKEKGFEQVMEEVAYTWFNRFSALHFMEVNGYLPSHVRVFTDEENNFKPQIITEAIHLEMDGLDMEIVYAFKEADKTEELYKYLLITQCNALNKILPGMFQRISDYTELLLPDNLLREGSVIEKMIAEIPEDNFDISSQVGQVEIIGWLYQYYNTEQNELVYDGTLSKSRIPKELVSAATTIYTPDWAVRYMVENSLGHFWLDGHSDVELQSQWKYYLEEPKQEASVQAQLEDIRTYSKNVKPEEIRCIDPCMGSGHILCYMFDVLVKIYEAYGYTTREAAASIVENNLWGLDIDERAAQLSYFAVMMKARQYDRRFFSRGIQPHVYSVCESNNLDRAVIEYFVNGDSLLENSMQILFDELHDAKEYGSVLKMNNVDFASIYRRFEAVSEEINIYSIPVMTELLPFVKVAEAMTQKYDVVVTNPPYLGSSRFGSKLSDYVTNNYPDVKSDLSMVMFKHALSGMVKKNGYVAFITTTSWMYLRSFEKLREYILTNCDFESVVEFGTELFEGKVGHNPIVAWVVRNGHTHKRMVGIRLVDFCYSRRDEKEPEFFNEENRYYPSQDEFSKLPACPIAYWVGENLINAFANPTIGDIAKPRQGLATGENNRFTRLWFELNLDNISFDSVSREAALATKKRWFPYNKGGEFRKWYGNNDYVVNWENDGIEIRNFKDEKGKLRSRPQNMDSYFKPSVTWSKISSGSIAFRYKPAGHIFDVAGTSVFADDSIRRYIHGFCNSKVALKIAQILSPTLNYEVGHIASFPIIYNTQKVDSINRLVERNIELCKIDWDSFEVSWDFCRNSLVRNSIFLKEAFTEWAEECESRFIEVKENEEKINRIFIDIYGLQDELTPQIENKVVTVRRANLTRDIKNLISYAVGCMFGRYSLDVEGLVYAGGEWDASKYRIFPVDRDNIIPICDDEYFEDDIVGRFIKFIEVVYGKETLEENLKFIAEALDGKGNARDVIRDYFLNDFYREHCSMYSGNVGRRPIYWQFDSGKKNGFKALIYMHRYREDTIARIRTDYVHEQQSRYRTAIADLEQRINGASTSDRVKLNKQFTKLKDQESELRSYEEKIHHLADQMIRIDLDDGVKNNYEIFKDVLAKIK